MYKKANSPPPYWQSILTKIKNLGLRPEIIAMLNNFNQIVWDTTPPPSEPNAVAYVTNEDKNADGKIDKIHFVLSKFPPNATEDQMDSIVEMVAKTLVHEYGHIEDYDLETDTFPGGEAAAERAEQAYKPILEQRLEQMTSENKDNNLENIAGDIKMLNELVKLANHLDGIGEVEISNKIDMIITKISQDTRLYGSDPSAGVHPMVLEKKEEMIIERAKDAIEKIKDGYYGSVVTKYALTPSLGAQTPLNRYMTTSGAINSVLDAERFLADFKLSIPAFQNLYDQAGMLDSYYPRRVRGIVLDLERNIRERKDMIAQVARPSAPQVDAVAVNETEVPAAARQSDPVKTLKDPNVLRVEEIIGAPKTGSWKELINGKGFRYLRRFLENNSNNIVAGLETSKLGPLTRGPDGRLRHEPLEQFADPDKYVSKILSVGVKGFAVRGGSEAVDNSYSSWRKFIEELNDAANRVVTASHGGDYMSEFHAKSIEDSAEEIVEGLKEGKELDPWQKSYLAQADLMTDNVEKRLEVMSKQLDKLFKY